MKFINWLVSQVKVLMVFVAKALNLITGGHIRPSQVTALSLFGHGLVVWALVADRPIKAAAMIIFFGLMDSLDGSLARLQKRVSRQGMFFDAVSDRVKEVMIYSGLSVFLWHQGEDLLIWLTVAVGGSSLLVSYIKAKGEMAVSHTQADPQKLNRLFSDGLGRYEIRMFILIVGLISGYTVVSLIVLFVLNCMTSLLRFWKISAYLNRSDV